MIDVAALVYGLPYIAWGLVGTLVYCAIGTLCGIVFGIVVTAARLSRFAVLRASAASFVELFRNTPFLVQAFLVYFGLAQIGVRLSPPVAGVLVLSAYGAAQFSEIMRAAIASVPAGQMEAVRALGIGSFDGMRRIVVPQCVGYLVPMITNQVIGLIKDSAGLSVIAVPELATASQTVVGETFRPIETYLVVGAVYWLLTSLVARAIQFCVRQAGRRRVRLAMPQGAMLGAIGASHD